VKKVLIITYYWPPCGGIGVLRCLKLAKYLRNYGWEPIIYTADKAQYPSFDQGNFKDIPEKLTVLRQPIFEPYGFYKQFTGLPSTANANHALVATDHPRGWRHKIAVWIRGNLFIPDARTFWIRPSVKFLLNYLKDNPVDAIFSDGPPHTNNVIASRIKQKTQIPWLADFQDPWTQVDLYSKLRLTAWADRKYKALEQETFAHADKITISSPSSKADLEGIGARNVSVFYWGYDQDDFENLIPNPDKLLTITHSGLLGEDRNPDVFFEAIAELAAELPNFSDMLRVQLIGHLDGSVREAIRKNGIEKMISLIPQLSRAESLQYLANSQVLLLLLNKADNVMGRIPGKLFEYLAVKRPILCLGPGGSDTDKLIGEAKGGVSVDYADKMKLKKMLFGYFRTFKDKKMIPSETQAIDKYTNYALTGQIAAYLDEISKR
jgi:glycosyltransferase involved in cell wall biosynthesis